MVIKLVETYKRSVEIEAESEDAARDIVAEKINSGDIDIPCDGECYEYGYELFSSELKKESKGE